MAIPTIIYVFWMYIKELVLLSSETYFFVQIHGVLPPQKKKKLKFLRLLVHWKVATRKKIVHSKLATRKKMLHWETATGKELCIENWLPEKLLYCFLVNCLMDLLFVNFFRKFLLVPGF